MNRPRIRILTTEARSLWPEAAVWLTVQYGSSEFTMWISAEEAATMSRRLADAVEEHRARLDAAVIR